MAENKLLEVENLKTYFHTEEGVIKAVDDISFNVYSGETLGVVGESGCGKSITSLSIINLIPKPRGILEGGHIFYYMDSDNALDIAELHHNSKQMRSIRGNDIAMIFQEPMTSLNPVYTIGQQIMEAILLHQDVTKMEARKKAIDMLEHVGISAPHQRIDEYPHQFSGGMRQRAMIAMALSCEPNLLIADEPTTALDVTIEAQILELMNEIKKDFGMSIMIITHDLGVIGEMADRVIVMYMGKVVERASIDEIFYNTKHPYTKGLLMSIPEIGIKKRLTPITGSVPNPYFLPPGCYFAPRCSQAKDICHHKKPEVIRINSEHFVDCWLYE